MSEKGHEASDPKTLSLAYLTAVGRKEFDRLPEPVLAFRPGNGSALSVEFAEDAPDESQARAGAWLELETDDPAALKRRILEAGVPEVEYPGNDHFYFAVPGGQVLRLVPAPGG